MFVFVAFYGVLFKENSKAAYSALSLWNSIGGIIAFGYQSSLCLSYKIYIMLIIYVFSIAGYGIVEYRERFKQKSK